MPIAAVLGYLLGSVPTGLILTRVAGLGDIRNIGSGNIGATNVLRTGNKLLAAATLLLDTAKGAAAVLLAPVVVAAIFSSPELEADKIAQFAGLAAFLGHLYPAWLGFRGGKGVATYIGVTAALFWPAAILFCLIWLLMAAVFRYSSLSALVGAVIAPVAAGIFTTTGVTAMLALMSMLLIMKHHANIRRLMNGEEPKIGQKSES
ncbi:MAG: glycerol-3-phosphate 1-O-acyltransferase PlsY [Pseudomonadota bacterium]